MNIIFLDIDGVLNDEQTYDARNQYLSEHPELDIRSNNDIKTINERDLPFKLFATRRGGEVIDTALTKKFVDHVKQLMDDPKVVIISSCAHILTDDDITGVGAQQHLDYFSDVLGLPIISYIVSSGGTLHQRCLNIYDWLENNFPKDQLTEEDVIKCLIVDDLLPTGNYKYLGVVHVEPGSLRDGYLLEDIDKVYRKKLLIYSRISVEYE